MYICIDCGSVFDESEIAVDSYNHASHGERPAVEKWVCCPRCGGYITDAVACKVCGEWFYEDDLHGGVCDSCIEDNSDIETCMQVSNVKESVELDVFLLSMFSVDQIENILQEELRKCQTVDTKPFIDGDKDWFGERLAEMGVKK